MIFHVGLHKPHYLSMTDAHGTPLLRPDLLPMTSRQHVAPNWHRLAPDPLRSLVLDSGGFWEVTRHGRHRTPPATYASEVRRLHEIFPGDGTPGTGLMWAAVQDWMCEDPALHRTGLTVRQHQRLTVRSYLDLRGLAPDVRWLPVLQGRTVDDYLRHVEMHAREGVFLDGPIGLGSVCRRQGTREVHDIVRALHREGVTGLHAFGAKTSGLRRYGHLLLSSDSTAWLEDSIHRGHQRACSRPVQASTGRHFPPGHCPGCLVAFHDRTVAVLANAVSPTPAEG